MVNENSFHISSQYRDVEQMHREENIWILISIRVNTDVAI